MAWIRKIGNNEELMFASDSRLRAGYAWDCAPKIFPFIRGDSAISFAGSTEFAYPIIAQLQNAAQMWPDARDPATDLTAWRGYALRVLRQMDQLMVDKPKRNGPEEVPDVQFIIGGYSWVHARFGIWILYFNAANARFEFRTPITLHKNSFAIIGTAESNTPRMKGIGSGKRRPRRNAVGGFAQGIANTLEATKREILNKSLALGRPEGAGFNMEPLEVLRDFCRDPKRHYVGGAPQVVCIDKTLVPRSYAVYWPERSGGTLSLMGRALLLEEKASNPIVDLDKL
jgi:hypothetical protein